MSLDELKVELDQQIEMSKVMGGQKKLDKRRSEGFLNARERVDVLADEGSFWEMGGLARSIRPEDREKSPADGKVSGFIRVDGRQVGVVSNDFTVMAASSSKVNGDKIAELKAAATRRGVPIAWLGESTGARMPDVMGADAIGAGRRSTQYLRMRDTPWVSAVLGHCYGSSSWYASMSDFVVMRRGARMAVASPKLASMATGEEVDEEALAGWELHSQQSGLVDAVVDTDEEALEIVKKFLAYVPSHSGEAPPITDYEVDPEKERDRAEALSKLIPESRTRAYDMRRVLKTIVDEDSLLEFKATYARSIITGLGRINGRPVGFIANNPMFKGGAIDVDAASKATSFLVFCDSFNFPIVFLADQPGFLIGVEGEKKAATGRVMNWMNALSLCSVPKIAIVARKTYGQAVLNMGLGGNADLAVSWTTGELSFMDPKYAVKIVYGELEEGSEEYEKAFASMAKQTSPYASAVVNNVANVIDPRETREYLARAFEVHNLDSSNGVSDGNMRTWPTTVM